MHVIKKKQGEKKLKIPRFMRKQYGKSSPASTECHKKIDRKPKKKNTEVYASNSWCSPHSCSAVNIYFGFSSFPFRIAHLYTSNNKYQRKGKEI